ncbi:ATP-binding protein [Sulfitobacter sp. S190]|uniref:sensor histidine kinase n=1 Tax=Sulfitobacter sp. S190 TaxID=2867022 RepID=UPI0021A37F08|nr:ATP-binding protein [Sulfitobacter sp. S190]UWR23142.1 hypothetical protein K3756_03855 [Sulfitobacter sp. S190]
MHASQNAVPSKPVSGTQDVDDFIYLMSHDVRASVRALLELPHWIREDLNDAGIKVSGSVEETIEMMNRHTGRLDRMLVDLLTYSRIGRMQEVKPVNLVAAVDEVLEELQLPQGFTVSRALEAQTATLGDRDILTLLSALVGNAVKHHDTGTGKVMIVTRAERDMLRIVVCDDGPGIDPKFHEKVVGAMTTLRPRDDVEGSGMGLANVRKIAAHYGGDLRLGEGLGGRGLRVDVRLPLHAKPLLS